MVCLIGSICLLCGIFDVKINLHFKFGVLCNSSNLKPFWFLFYPEQIEQAKISIGPTYNLYSSFWRIYTLGNFQIHFCREIYQRTFNSFFNLCCLRRFVTIVFVQFQLYIFNSVYFLSVFLLYTIAVVDTLYENMLDERKRSNNTTSPVYQPTTIPEDQVKILPQYPADAERPQYSSTPV